MSAPGFRDYQAMTDLDLWLRINIGRLPETGDKMAVDWFTRQTDETGAVARAEMKRREALEADGAL